MYPRFTAIRPEVIFVFARKLYPEIDWSLGNIWPRYLDAKNADHRDLLYERARVLVHGKLSQYAVELVAYNMYQRVMIHARQHADKPLRRCFSVARNVQAPGHRGSLNFAKGVPHSHRNLFEQRLQRCIPRYARMLHNTKISSLDHAISTPTSTTSPSTITVPIGDGFKDFSAILLRDACSCPRCVHPSTNQRLFSTADIPATIQAQRLEGNTSTDNVSFRWTSDVQGFDGEHTTTFSVSELEELSQTGSLPVTRTNTEKRPMLWTQEGLRLPDYDFEEYIANDKALYKVMDQLNTHGVAFVTNIPGDENALEKIATRMGPIKDTFYGYTWDVRTVPAAINAAYTSHDLGFHTDLLYFQHPPHIQLLHCIQSASTGGASVFADAYKAAMDLFHIDQDAFEVLATIPVNYHYNHPDSNVYRTTKPVIDLHPLRVGTDLYSNITAYKAACHKHSLENGGPGWTDAMLIPCMDKINWGPPFLAPFSLHQQQAYDVGCSGKEVLPMLNDKVERWHQAARKFNMLLQRPEYLYERKMNPGECVLFDNTRTLHSRRAFDAADVGKPRWLKGTYVDKDPFFSKMRVLERKFR